MNRPPYADLHDLSEDQRIEEIGKMVMGQRKTVGFVVDSEPGKATRYIQKLQAKFPGIQVLGQWPGPVAKAISIKVGPPSYSKN